MARNEIFDSSYVTDSESTSVSQKRSEIKSFLKETVKKEEMTKYGTSKPKRVVIKAKLTNG